MLNNYALHYLTALFVGWGTMGVLALVVIPLTEVSYPPRFWRRFFGFFLLSCLAYTSIVTGIALANGPPLS